MLEPLPIAEDIIFAHLREAYGLVAETLAFLPIGVDTNTAVYHAQAGEDTGWFIKLRRGAFDVLAVEIPRYLADRGVREIIPPLRGRDGALWTRIADEYTVFVYPFIEGKDAYQVRPNEEQWVQFGAALRRIHDTRLPPALEGRLPREVFSPRFRDAVRRLQAQAETGPFFDQPAEAVAQVMRSHRGEIEHMVLRAGELARALMTNPPPFGLCHADIHAGNLHLTPGGELYIVDWDAPAFAPREHDLGLIGGCGTWRDPREVALFFQGYNGANPVEINAAALAYYRYERILTDITEFCEQLFLSSEGKEDRAQAVVYFSGQFEPECEVDLALKGDLG